jgi:hypothetical protein
MKKQPAPQPVLALVSPVPVIKTLALVNGDAPTVPVPVKLIVTVIGPADSGAKLASPAKQHIHIFMTVQYERSERDYSSIARYVTAGAC